MPSLWCCRLSNGCLWIVWHILRSVRRRFQGLSEHRIREIACTQCWRPFHFYPCRQFNVGWSYYTHIDELPLMSLRCSAHTNLHNVRRENIYIEYVASRPSTPSPQCKLHCDVQHAQSCHQRPSKRSYWWRPGTTWIEEVYQPRLDRHKGFKHTGIQARFSWTHHSRRDGVEREQDCRTGKT